MEKEITSQTVTLGFFNIFLLIAANKVGRYRIERSGIYSPYVLKVFDLKDADCGNYYCCLPLNKSDNVSSTIRSEDCQRFVLWVRGTQLGNTESRVFRQDKRNYLIRQR